MLCLREATPADTPQEADLARRWFRLPTPLALPLSDGSQCRLLHVGRPGGPQGPDVRDAVIAFAHGQTASGNVEFHIRNSDWYTHQHYADPRYNNVMLHVVLMYDSTRSVMRQDGQTVPVCSLNDSAPRPNSFPGTTYPCEGIMPAMTAENRAALLRQAGLERFEQKTDCFLKQLRDAFPSGSFSACDTCLIPALAEALGYGRDRAFFRAAGLRLVGLLNDDSALPEPQGRASHPSPLDTGRLQALGQLVKQGRVGGVWETIQRLLNNDILTTLRTVLCGISLARADIVICNVVLPFAAAVAMQAGDQALYAHARRTYLEYPGLASNQVTRAMSKQLRLASEPDKACQQQGLHHIYAQACQQKCCEACPVTQWRLAL